MITICLITNNNYMLSRLCIENLIRSCVGISYKLFIIDNNSSDKRIIDFGKEVSDYHLELKESKNDSYCYNQLMKIIDTEYICLFPNCTLVNNNWLSDLKTEFDYIERSGIATIYTFGDKGNLSPLLSNNDKMEYVYTTFLGETNGIQFFNKEIIKGIGGLDISQKLEEFSLRQFSFRCNRAGRKSYYLTGQYGIDLLDKKELKTKIDIEKYDIEIDEFRKGKKLKFEL